MLNAHAGSCSPFLVYGAPILSIEAIDHIVFNVRDVEVSAKWHELVLGMKRQHQPVASGEIRTTMIFRRNKSACGRSVLSQEQ